MYIVNCGGCPYFKNYNGYVKAYYCCSHPKYQGEYYSEPYKNPPSWCPLPNSKGEEVK